MSERLLQIENLKTWLDSAQGVVRAIDGIGLSIAPGETFALVGESGCGKTMTALSILRLLPEAGRIVDGKVTLGDLDLLALPEAAMRNVRGRRVAMIFQEPSTSLNPVLTVGAQIQEVLYRHTALRGEAARMRALELLDAVGVPDKERRVEEYPFQLSGGLKQRVMIALALAAEPDLLIADEPTTALDVTIQAQVLDLLKELQSKNGMAILLITHDLGIVAQMAHKVAVMYAGEIIESAPRERFFSSPQHPYSQKLFAALPGSSKRGEELAVIKGQVPPLTQEFTACRFADRCDHAWDLCRKTAPGWTETAPDHAVRCHLYSAVSQKIPPFPPLEKGGGGGILTKVGAEGGEILLGTQDSALSTQDGGDLLKVSDLKVYFPIYKGIFKRVVANVKAVDGVSLDISPGRTLALVGESGCGKTTVGKGILQLVMPTSGSVIFDGDELIGLGYARLRAKRAEFQIIFQDPYSSLNPRMRVSEIIEEGMNALGVGADEAERQRLIDVLLGQVGLHPEAKWRYPHEFSGGQRQRIAIARALAVNPKLLICDEPTSALDVSVQAQILNLLKELQQRLKLAYLFITHNIGVVEYLAHEVAVMYLGRIVERGSAEEVLNQPRHPYTQALLSAVPVIDRESQRQIIRLQGEMPSPVNPPSGCHFHPRCPHVMPECKEIYPKATAFSATHSAHCHLYKSA